MINFPSFQDQCGADNRGKIDSVAVYDSLGAFAAAADKLPRLPDDVKEGGSWSGGEMKGAVIAKVRNGDASRVAASDALMIQLENAVDYPTSAFQTFNSVAGGAPNVGAFLAGHPLNMRVRRRVAVERAPLNIVIDIGSSSGIRPEAIERRGAAILALVRVLSVSRPVNLYLATAFLVGGTRHTHTSSAIAVHIDTSPLDLARAAHMICHPGVARLLFYGLVWNQVGCAEMQGLPWAYGNSDFARANGVRYWQRALGTDELFYIAAPHLTDASIANPVAWIKEMIEKYGIGGE